MSTAVTMAVTSELADFCFDESSFFFPLVVVYDLGIGLPVRQLVEGFSEGIEPRGWPAEQLKEPCPHGVGRDV